MIGSSENRISYNGNGIATEFAYNFIIIEKSDIKVLHVAADGTEQLLTKDYYVDMEKSVVLYPGYAPGAEIPEQNRPPILPVGERLVLYREVPITQESALDKHWPFNVIENGLDKLTIICQQIWDRLQRSFYVSESTSTNFDPKVPIEAGKTFRVKDDGTGFEVTEDPGKVIDGATALLKQTTEQAVSANEAATNAQNAAKEVKEIYGDGNFTPLSDLLGGLGTKLKRWGSIFANKVFATNLPIVYNSVAKMKADTMLWEGMHTKTLGYYAPNDGGGAYYLIRVKTDADIDDGGSLHELANGLVAELIIENATVCPEQFGAKGDGITNNTMSFFALSNYASSRDAVSIFITSGKTFVVGDVCLRLNCQKVYIFGNGKIVKNKSSYYTGVNAPLIRTDDSIDLVIDGVHFEYNVLDKTKTSGLDGGGHYFILADSYQLKRCIIKNCIFDYNIGHVYSDEYSYYGVINVGKYNDDDLKSCNVTIENNIINNPLGRIVYCSGTENVIIANNKILNVGYCVDGTNVDTSSCIFGIRVLNSKKVNIYGNTILCDENMPAVSGTNALIMISLSDLKNIGTYDALVHDNIIKLCDNIKMLYINHIYRGYFYNNSVYGTEQAIAFWLSETATDCDLTIKDNSFYNVNRQRIITAGGNLLAEHIYLRFIGNLIYGLSTWNTLYHGIPQLNTDLYESMNRLFDVETNQFIKYIGYKTSEQPLKITKDSNGYITDVQLY